jgi:hypothetical protein
MDGSAYANGLAGPSRGLPGKLHQVLTYPRTALVLFWTVGVGRTEFRDIIGRRRNRDGFADMASRARDLLLRTAFQAGPYLIKPIAANQIIIGSQRRGLLLERKRKIDRRRFDVR